MVLIGGLFFYDLATRTEIIKKMVRSLYLIWQRETGAVSFIKFKKPL